MSLPIRTLGQESARIVLVGLFMLIVASGWGGILLMLTISSAYGVYEGFARPGVYWCLAVLVLIEVSYGIPLGMLSLAYLVVVVAIQQLMRIVALAPLAQESTLGIIAVAQAVVLAWVGALVMAVVSVGIGKIGYHYGALMVRLGSLYHGRTLIGCALGVLVVLLILRWVDTPWRRVQS